MDYETQKHPIDVTSLSINQVLSADAVDRIMGAGPHGAERHEFAVMELRSYIEHEFRDRNIRLLPIHHLGGIRIIGGTELLDYLARRDTQAIGKLARNQHRRIVHVDRAELTGEEQERHTRQIALGALRLSALKKAGKQRLAPAKATQRIEEA